MAKFDRPPITSTTKRLPIVFCLDVSPSMGWELNGNSSSMALLNAAVASFFAEIKQDAKASVSAEVAFVTFSTNIEQDTDFKTIRDMQIPQFNAVEKGGTQMAQAVLRSIEKIEKRRKELENMEVPYYAPFLVLVTDGNPDENDDAALQAKALAEVKRHCDSHVGAREIIVPFVIGVGDHISPKTLNEYSAGFVDGYFPVSGNAAKAQVQFSKVFKLIGNSTIKSVHLNARGNEQINTIKHDMSDVWRTIMGM